MRWMRAADAGVSKLKELLDEAYLMALRVLWFLSGKDLVKTTSRSG
jgi:hypothetical protein